MQVFPGWTHLLAAVAFPCWFIGGQARLYGIDTRGNWWQGFGDVTTVLTVLVIVLVLPPAVALEAWAVLRRIRWLARTAVIAYVVVSGLLTFGPAGLRFFGDTSPTPIDFITVSLADYAIATGAQLVCAYAVCRRMQSGPLGRRP